MVLSTVWAITFVESFLVYSGLRYFDQASTKQVADRVNIQNHEINPLLTRLAKRWGLNNAFRITWLVFSTGTATIDATLNTIVSFGIPAAALLFGSVHLLAGAHNMELFYQVKDSSKEQVEADTVRFAQRLSLLDWKGQASLLIEKYSFTFVVAIFSLLIFVSFFYGDAIGKWTKLPNLGPVMSNAALFELTGLLMFFPTLFLGTILWSRRIVRSYMRGELSATPVVDELRAIEIAVPILEDAIRIARENNAPIIRLQVEPAGARVHTTTILESNPTTS